MKIYGGIFSAEAGTDGTPFVLNQSDDITEQCIYVYGGTFIGFNPAEVNEAHGAITSFVADGYKSTKIGDAYYVTAEDESPVLPVSGQDELEELLSKISDGTEAEVNLSEGTYTMPTNLPEGVTISGNGDGKVVIDGSETAVVKTKGVTVKNLVVKGNGTFTVEFVNCKYADGTPITSDIMDTDGVNTNASWIIDGETFTY